MLALCNGCTLVIALIVGAIIGIARAQSLISTPDPLDMAYIYAAIIAGVTQSIQILRSDAPIKWRVAVGEILGSAFLGYAVAFGAATYFFKTQTTLHGLLVIAGAAGWLGTNAISGSIKIILGRLGVTPTNIGQIMPTQGANTEAPNDTQ